MNQDSLLARGNQALRLRQYAGAMSLYLRAARACPALTGIIAANMRFTAQCFRTDDSSRPAPRVAVCGWDLASNSAGRAYALAELHAKIAEVEMIDVAFSQHEDGGGGPIDNGSFVVHKLAAEDEKVFFMQAIEFAAAHPYDLLHLCRPRMQNILVGLIYKLIWGAGVVVDLDEELVVPDADMKNLFAGSLDAADKRQTDVSFNPLSEFDGITVTDKKLQERFGGAVIRDARADKSGMPEREIDLHERTVAVRLSRLKTAYPRINRNPHSYELRLTAFLSRFGNLPDVFLSAGAIAGGTEVAKGVRDGALRREDSRIFYQKLRFLEKSRDYDQDIKKKLQENERKIAKVLEGNPSTCQPLISVIMPTYNRAAIITESVLSVLEQSYANFELLICDDGSTDNTRELIEDLHDERIRYLHQVNHGAAAARNHALSHASGELITYLDTDNYWHPAYLKLVVAHFSKYSGQSALYFDYVDFHVDKHNAIHIKSTGRPDFVHENLLNKPFIDLNTFAHKRELYDLFGGFDESLVRRQDYDVILKFTWLRDPLHIKLMVGLYQRNDSLQQITQTCGRDMRCIPIINRKIERYFNDGLPVVRLLPVKKITVITWNISRSDFLKAFSVAEALSKKYEVELISFDFFAEGIFGPVKDVVPDFATKYFKGSAFPDFFEAMHSAIEAVTGDIMYVIQPYLPSLGLALLVNEQRATPFILEVNQLESPVGSPDDPNKTGTFDIASLDGGNKELLQPYSGLWSQLLDSISRQVPTLVTDNNSLDAYYGNSALRTRNLKDEHLYNPELYDRDTIRQELGFNGNDRVILFGGLAKRPEGIDQLVELVEKLDDPRYKLLYIESGPTAAQADLVRRCKSRLVVVPPREPAAAARVHYAADLVILWLDPDDTAGHYRMPSTVTDALAMKTPIIANDIVGLGELGRQGYLKIVPFADWYGMIGTIDNLLNDQAQTRQMCEAGRRLYLRQFSYRAGITNFELAAYRAMRHGNECYPAARYFAKHFNKFCRDVMGAHIDFAPAAVAGTEPG